VLATYPNEQSVAEQNSDVADRPFLAESGRKPKVVIDQTLKRSAPLSLRLGSSEAEAARASASFSLSLSFELKVNEVKLCLDCINRERLGFRVFVFHCIELFHACYDGNYLAQMQLSGL
jgi:hypothetical protein